MVSSNLWSSLDGVAQIFQRIQSINSRIDSIEGKKPEVEGELSVEQNLKQDGSESPSFAQVFGKIRENLPPRANRWVVEDALQKASQATGLDLDLIKAVVQVESGGNSSAVSGAGARGLMQLIDSTAAGLGVKDSYDPHQNALGGASYLKQQLTRFGGNLSLALAAYNAGPAAVAKYAGVPPYPETMNYVKSVQAAYQSLKSKSQRVNNGQFDRAEHFNFDSDMKLS